MSDEVYKCVTLMLRGGRSTTGGGETHVWRRGPRVEARLTGGGEAHERRFGPRG